MADAKGGPAARVMPVYSVIQELTPGAGLFRSKRFKRVKALHRYAFQNADDATNRTLIPRIGRGLRPCRLADYQGAKPRCLRFLHLQSARRAGRDSDIAATVTLGRLIHYLRRKQMNQDRVAGNWLQFKGKVKEQWGKLTDDDLDVIDGKRDQLLGRVQERHGVTREEAEKQLTSFHERNPTNFFERY